MHSQRDDENWVVLPDYPLYLVSDHGRIFSVRHDRVLSPRETSDGHLQVILSNAYGRKSFYVHRLVAECFIRRIDENWHVKHLDRRYANNHVSNLEIVSGGRTERFRGYSARRLRGRPVYVPELDEVFTNAHEAAEFIEGSFSAIYACLRGERSHHLGYTFKYLW